MLGNLGDFSNLLKAAKDMQGKLAETQKALATRRFEGDAGGGMVRATVDGRGTLLDIKIEPQAVLSQQVTTFPVLTRIDNADGLLLPGMNADVEVVIHQRPRVLTVPNEAVKSMGDAGQVAQLLGLPFDRDNLRAEARTGAGAVGGEAMAQERRRGQPGGGRGRPGQETAGEGGAATGRGDAADSEAGDGEEELDDGDIDFNKVRGMSAEERTEYMDGFTEDAKKRFR
ncbi:MAG: YbaB/EbfC family nucleoid-associated protein, partial [Planctomycetes bacterium]|nr:YbaB/EbfC family nucleoid-associated protein [Planctomycetota bacterium]